MYITCAYELTKYMLRYVVEGHVCRYILYTRGIRTFHAVRHSLGIYTRAKDDFCSAESLERLGRFLRLRVDEVGGLMWRDRIDYGRSPPRSVSWFRKSRGK